MRILSVVGTRAEAIKMAPLVRRLARAEGVEARLCVAGPHRAMVDPVLALFDIAPDFELDIMSPDQGPAHEATAAIEGVSRVIGVFRPDRLLVQGGTSTAFAAALVGHDAKVPVGHVDAGLRTGEIDVHDPEEMNRRRVDDIATIFFASTEIARAALMREGKDDRAIHVTGSTAIDALQTIVARLQRSPSLEAQMAAECSFLDPDKKLILATGRRCENFGAGFAAICEALVTLAARSDVQIVFPVHLDPDVQEPVRRLLGGRANIRLIAPQDYLRFVYLMKRAHIILTDSGGIQEEAPALGKPVLLTREVTERPEAIAAGTVRLVGTDTTNIIEEAAWLLDHDAAYRSMSQAINPYGDGRAPERIIAHLVPQPLRHQPAKRRARFELREELVL